MKLCAAIKCMLLCILIPTTIASNQELLQTVATAFQQNDGAPLAKFLDAKGKIFMEAESLGIQRLHYSSGQCLQQLQGLFKKVRTVAFAFEGDDASSAQKGLWTVQSKATGRIQSYAVYIGVRGGSGDGYIDSIRITLTVPMKSDKDNKPKNTL